MHLNAVKASLILATSIQAAPVKQQWGSGSLQSRDSRPPAPAYEPSIPSSGTSDPQPPAYSAGGEAQGNGQGCSSYLIIDTRASGESQGHSSAFVDMNKQILAQVPGGQQCDTVYSANYDQQDSSGVQDITRHVQSASQAGQCVVLEGYSQGADAMVKALLGLAGSSDAIKAIVLFGNQNGDADGGKSTVNANGIEDAPACTVPPQYYDRTFDMCAQGDGICGASGGSAGRMSYSANRAQNLGVQFVVEKLKGEGAGQGNGGISQNQGLQQHNTETSPVQGQAPSLNSDNSTPFTSLGKNDNESEVNPDSTNGDSSAVVSAETNGQSDSNGAPPSYGSQGFNPASYGSSGEGSGSLTAATSFDSNDEASAISNVGLNGPSGQGNLISNLIPLGASGLGGQGGLISSLLPNGAGGHAGQEASPSSNVMPEGADGYGGQESSPVGNVIPHGAGKQGGSPSKISGAGSTEDEASPASPFVPNEQGTYGGSPESGLDGAGGNDWSNGKDDTSSNQWKRDGSWGGSASDQQSSSSLSSLASPEGGQAGSISELSSLAGGYGGGSGEGAGGGLIPGLSQLSSLASPGGSAGGAPPSYGGNSQASPIQSIPGGESTPGVGGESALSGLGGGYGGGSLIQGLTGSAAGGILGGGSPLSGLAGGYGGTSGVSGGSGW